jgi:hypothetical protein
VRKIDFAVIGEEVAIGSFEAFGQSPLPHGGAEEPIVERPDARKRASLKVGLEEPIL